MDDTVPKEDSPPDFNKIDLSQLQGFSFGTQWTQDKSGASDKRDARPGHDDRRPGLGDGPADRRDRRAFRRPLGAGEPSAPRSGSGPAPHRPSGPRTDSSRAPGRDHDDPRRGDSPGGQGRGGSYDRAPYDSPVFATTFYPDDATFDALVKTVRASCRTIELFEIARTILGKLERFTVHVARREPMPQGGAKPGEAPAAPEAPRLPVFISVPDGTPFETEEAAIAYVLDRHIGLFFDKVEAEVEPPKGNFQVVNRCGVTGELLGPPNYHRYIQIMQQHHAAKLGRMPFEAYRSRIETVRDPEAIQQWLEKMKKVTRYVWKTAAPAAVKPVATEPSSPVPPEGTEASSSVPPAGNTADGPVAPPPGGAETAPPPTFDSIEEARAHLLAHERDKVVRSATHARFPGRDAELLPAGEIRRAVEGALERQRRFPLDTANALRGRLRREHFTIFKKGAKGVSYVCAVKRRFRVPGQVFSENIDALISFIEAHPLIKAGELAQAFLRIAEGSPGAVELTAEQREKVVRLQGDLVWLVREGYVTEFIDGGLYAPPPIPESRKKEAEREEHDPENFPERPNVVVAAAPSEPEVPVAEETPVASEPEPVLAPEAAPAVPEPAPPVAE